MGDFDSPVGHYGRAQASRNLRSNNNNWAKDRLDTVYNPGLDYSISHWRDIDRWNSDNVRQSPYGAIQSGRSGYADMLSDGVTGPRVSRAQGMSWSASTNFGRGSATTPAQEIGRLQSAMGTAGNILGGVGGLLGQVGAYRRNLARVNSIKAPQLPSPGSMQGVASPSGSGNRNARGAASTTPPGPRPMMQSPTRGGLVNMNNKQDINAVANWKDDQVSSAPGYGGAFLRNMRNTAQQSQLENAIRNGGSPQDLPAPGGFVVGPKPGNTNNPSNSPEIGISFPPKIDTNDTPRSRKSSRDPVGRGRFRDKNKKYSTWENAVTNDNISFS